MPDTDFDPDRDVVVTDLTIDDLMELQKEARFLDSPLMEGRIEVEVQNAVAYDDYNPRFTGQELYQIGTALIDAKFEHDEAGRGDRVDVIDRLAEDILDAIEGETMLTVEKDGDTTVDEIDASDIRGDR